VWRRYQTLIYAFSLLFWVLPAAAQVEYDGVQMSAAGDVTVGYSGDYTSLGGGTDHGLGLGGTGTLSGSYYNPNFLSFSVQPYYNRSQSNGASGQIFDDSGYNGTVSLFQGSNFPGSISFNQIWDGTGSYGIPGTTGLTTRNNARSIAIGWSERIPDAPSVSISYARSDGASSVLGSDAQSDSAADSFGIRSAYRFRGWTLGAGFGHTAVDASTSGLIEGVPGETTNTSDNSFGVGAGHQLPLIHGGFGISFDRTDYNASYGGGTLGASHGTTDDASANLNFGVWRFPISSTAVYMDNVEGSFEESLIANGGTAMETTISPETRELLLNASTSYQIMRHVTANGFVARTEMFTDGQTFGVTEFGANVNFNLGRRWRGFSATIGMNDAADKQGNTGAGLVANAGYSGNIGRWEVGANFGYNENVQTLYAIYQTSSLTYGGSLHRRFSNGFSWSLAGGGGRTAFVNVKGSGSQGESISSSASWRGYTVGGNFSQSSGTSVLTPGGLVPVPAPVVNNNLVVYNGRGYGFGAGGSPIRRLSISVAYNNSSSNTLGSNASGPIATSNNTSLISGMLTYQFRKMYFNASALQFRQGISTSGTAPSSVTTYYFGVSRWFKLF
jgi:hypothetical protein